MLDMISVIVPVYNAELYLDRCIQSIVEQTYRELDIILVDDGSIDSSAELCDQWAQKDSRVRVFHQKNGGVSSARNKGIKNAKGSLIAFVDSDDFIELDYFEVLYKKMNELKSDIVVCNFFPEYSNENIEKIEYKMIEAEQTVVDNVSLYTDYFCACAYTYVIWGKLYKKEYIKNVSFRRMNFAEDTLYLQEVFAQNPTTSLITYYGYHYYVNESSITNDDTKLADRYMCELKALWFTYCLVRKCHDKNKLCSIITNIYYQLMKCTNCYLEKGIWLNQEEQKMFCEIMKEFIKYNLWSSKVVRLKKSQKLVIYSKIKNAL